MPHAVRSRWSATNGINEERVSSINGCGAAAVPVFLQPSLFLPPLATPSNPILPSPCTECDIANGRAHSGGPLRSIVLSTFQIVAPMPSLAPAQYLGIPTGLPNHHAPGSQIMGRPGWPVVRLFQAPSQVVL